MTLALTPIVACLSTAGVQSAATRAPKPASTALGGSVIALPALVAVLEQH
ncbi:MAG: hypothetical protein M0Z94_08565 [Dehalococcoidales bacterium]|nr:hypothetical protein [Dehalococcoidales bacterium]